MNTKFSTAFLPAALRGLTSRTSSQWITAVAIVATTMAALAVLGLGFATKRTHQREETLAQDIGQTIARAVVDTERDKDRLAPLVGLPCGRIISSLTDEERIAPYARDSFFVKDNVVYCSTAVGQRDTPLSSYVRHLDQDTQVLVRPGTPLLPHHPVLIVYYRLGSGSGIGFVATGTYIEDLLDRVRAAGAQSAIIIGSDGSSITTDGQFTPSGAMVPNDKGYRSPDGLFSVSVEGGRRWRAQDLGDAESVALLIGLILGPALVLGYFTRYMPAQRLVRRVRLGLKRGEFRVAYQPIVDVGTGQWIGAEALVRWHHPQQGLIMPGQFINEVEQSPTIARLTQFVLETALAELGELPLREGFRLSVNLAAFHVGMKCFPNDLGNLIAAGRRDMQIVFEITERILLDDRPELKNRLQRLRSHGAKFAVDDFGTEHSNLVLLQRFHFDYIKIDRQFIKDIAGDDRSLVEGVKLLADQVGATIVAEGVEESAQQSILKAIGVPLAQGFLFSKPRLVREFARGYMKCWEEVAEPLPQT